MCNPTPLELREKGKRQVQLMLSAVSQMVPLSSISKRPSDYSRMLSGEPCRSLTACAGRCAEKLTLCEIINRHSSAWLNIHVQDTLGLFKYPHCILYQCSHCHKVTRKGGVKAATGVTVQRPAEDTICAIISY